MESYGITDPLKKKKRILDAPRIMEDVRLSPALTERDDLSPTTIRGPGTLDDKLDSDIPLFQENARLNPPLATMSNLALDSVGRQARTGLFGNWGQPIFGTNKEGKGGVPIDLAVTLAGTAANALDPEGFGGRLGAGLANFMGPIYGKRIEAEAAEPDKVLARRLARAQITKAERGELPEMTGHIIPDPKSSTGFSYADKQGSPIAAAPAPKETTPSGKWYQDPNGVWKYAKTGETGQGVLPKDTATPGKWYQDKTGAWKYAKEGDNAPGVLPSQSEGNRYEDLGYGQKWDRVEKKIVAVPTPPRSGSDASKTTKPTEQDKLYTSYLKDQERLNPGQRPQSRWEFFEKGGKIDVKSEITSLNAQLGELGGMPVDLDMMATRVPTDEKGIVDPRFKRVLDESGLDYTIGPQIRKKDKKGWFTGDDYSRDIIIGGSKRAKNRSGRFTEKFGSIPTAEDDEEFNNGN